MVFKQILKRLQLFSFFFKNIEVVYFRQSPRDGRLYGDQEYD